LYIGYKKHNVRNRTLGNINSIVVVWGSTPLSNPAKDLHYIIMVQLLSQEQLR